MTNFRSVIKAMAIAAVMSVFFCSCNAAGGSDSYEVSSHESVSQASTSTPQPSVPQKLTGLCAKAVLSGTQLTFYYDDKDHASEGTVYAVSDTGYGPKGSPWKNSGFTSASFDDSCKAWNPSSLVFFFSGCTSVENIDFNNLNTVSVVDMSCMFKKCSSLKALDLTGFDTGNVIEMYRMFYECSALESITVDSSFNQKAAEIQSHGMYDGCTAQVING